jgi:hypothetical protein
MPCASIQQLRPVPNVQALRSVQNVIGETWFHRFQRWARSRPPRVPAFISSRFKEDAGAFKTFSSDFSRRFKVQKFLTLVHDRRYSRHWIFEAKKRFDLCVLDYIL